MDTVLQILGALGVVVLVVLAIAVIALVVFLRRIRKMLDGMAKTLSAASAGMAVPPRIHVYPAPEGVWEKPEEFAANKSTALQLGFKDVGTFTIEEMPGVRLNALAKPISSAYCIIYEHPQAGMFVDLVVCYEGGQGLTVTSAPTGQQLDVRPGQKKIYHKGMPLPQLYEKMMEERRDLLNRPIDTTPETFIEVFEKAYADEMDWRNSRGGATTEEIKRVGESEGKEVTDVMINMAKAIKAKEACEGLIPAFEERLRAKTNYGETQWEELRPRLVFIHDQMPLDLLETVFTSRVIEVPSIPNVGTPPREAFSTINSSFMPDRRFEKISALAEPLEVDVYLAPLPVKAGSTT